MNGRLLSRASLPIVLLLLAAGPGLARGSPPAGSSQAVGLDAGLTANGGWTIETVDSAIGVGSHVSIYTADPFFRISYYDAFNDDLKRARYVGSGGNCGTDSRWSCETVAATDDVGQFSSIVLSRIAYHDASSSAVRLATKGLFWQFETIDLTQGGHTSLKVGFHPHIAYQYVQSGHVDGLKHAQWVGGGTGNCGGSDWQCDWVDSGTGVGQYASLALDTLRQPRIAYYDGGSTALMYAYKNGGSWTIREILPTNSGEYASLAVDRRNGDLPHIAHYNASTGKLGYAVRVGSNGNCGFNSSTTKFEWQCDEIDSMGTNPHTRDVALELDRFGYPIIAYHSYIVTDYFSIVSLNVARPAAALGLQSGNCGPQNLWRCETLPSSRHPGDYLAIDVSYGRARIAFLDSEDFGALKLAYEPVRGVLLPLVSKSYVAP